MYKQQKVRIDIPKGYRPAQREAIAQAIVDFIRMRTLAENTDKRNRSFGDYTEAYAEQKGSSTVNLSATGDMLENLQVLRVYTDYIMIGYSSDYDGMGKVEGNRLGTYGNDVPVTAPRDFLGITQGDLNYILADFDLPDEDFARQQEDLIESARRLTPAQRERLLQERFLEDNDLDDWI